MLLAQVLNDRRRRLPLKREQASANFQALCVPAADERPSSPTTTFSKPATYSNCFTHSFTQGSSPNIRRTRNDDEYYGSSETSGRLPTTASSISSRSSSARRSGRAAQGVTGGHPSYQADTLTSIRRSKERSETHTDSPSRFAAKVIKNWFGLNHIFHQVPTNSQQ